MFLDSKKLSFFDPMAETGKMVLMSSAKLFFLIENHFSRVLPSDKRQKL
jgi:hypothetical protein